MIAWNSLGVCGVLHEFQVPQFGMVQIGEAAVDQSANEVQREARRLVTAQEIFRIGRAIRARVNPRRLMRSPR